MNKRKEYIAPHVEFSLLEEDEILAGTVTATAPDMPWDNDAKESDFVFDDSPEPKNNSLEPLEYSINFGY